MEPLGTENRRQTPTFTAKRIPHVERKARKNNQRDIMKWWTNLCINSEIGLPVFWRDNFDDSVLLAFLCNASDVLHRVLKLKQPA